MVQGKVRSHNARPGGKSRPKGKAMTQRKAVPHIRTPHDRTTAAINRRNEQLMAGRLAHEGGTLSIVPRPDRVERYEKGGAAQTEKQKKQLFHSSMTRHARMKKDGMQVGDVGAKKGAAKAGEVGKKRKRGLEGITKVGDEWFDEADKKLEDIRFESEDDEEGEEMGDAEAAADLEEAEPLEEEKEVEVEEQKEEAPLPLVDERPAKAAAVSAAPSAGAKAKSSTAGGLSGADEGDEVQQATKRAKALLGGWFASRSQKEGRQRQASNR